MSNPNPVTKWKPGVSMNPKGRPPKDQSLTELMKDYLSQPSREEPGLLNKQIFVRELVKHAGKDAAFARLALAYTEGEPLQRLEISRKFESLNDHELNALIATLESQVTQRIKVKADA